MKQTQSEIKERDKISSYLFLSVGFHIALVAILLNLNGSGDSIDNTQIVSMTFITAQQPRGIKNGSRTKKPVQKPKRNKLSKAQKVFSKLGQQKTSSEKSELAPAGQANAVTTKNFNENITSVNYLPNYPSVALRRGWEGKVLLMITVGPDGKAKKVKILKPSTYDAFNLSAEMAARRWKFKPDQQGKEFQVEKEIVFAIR